MFESDNVENNLIPENIISASNTYHDEWLKIVKETLQEALLTEPENVVMLSGGKKAYTLKSLDSCLLKCNIYQEHILTQNGNQRNYLGFTI